MVFEIQKASLLKRFSAFLLDFILMAVAATGFAALIGLVTGFDSYFDTYSEKSKYYASTIEISETVDFTIDFEIDKEDYDKLSEESRQRIDDAYAAFQRDPEVVRAYNMIFNLTLVILTLSILLAHLLLEFALPMIFGNGQTVGKRVFALGVIHTNGVKMSTLALFVRTLLGKYTIETMIPIVIFSTMLFGGGGLVGFLVLCALLILELFSFFKNRSFMMLHDSLASTTCVDLPSQRVFNTVEEMLEYKQMMHERIAKESVY